MRMKNEERQPGFLAKGYSPVFGIGLKVTAALAVMVLCCAVAEGQTNKVRASHENMDPQATTDEFGLSVPIPISFPARRFPAEEDFPTGPEVGERMPDFELPNQHGEIVNFHKARAGNKAAVVFFRSAVW